MAEIEPVEYLEFASGDLVFRVPSRGYYFSNTDSWARIEGNLAKVGHSDFVRSDPRKIVSFEPPDVGSTVAIFDGLCSFLTDRVSLDLRAPVSGTVVSVNLELVKYPALVKEDPYERGWVAQIELSDIEEDLGFLMEGNEYFEHARARVACGPRLGCPCSRRVRVARSSDES